MNDILVVGIDETYNVAISRNVGFIDIIYSPEGLVELAFNNYQYKNKQQLINNSLFKRPGYTAYQDDLDLLSTLLDELTLSINNAVTTAIDVVNPNARIKNSVLKGATVILHLG